MPKAPLLELRDVAKHFPSASGEAPVKAVDGVSLSVAAGETLGVVGESGCGKSTLTRLALRLIAPSGGEVRFEGAPHAPSAGRGAELFFRRKVQAVFQNPHASLNSRMTIRQILAEPMAVHKLVPAGGVEARVRELLALVGLAHADIDARTRSFSGGQLQRIAIARALVLDPELIVADEPTSALDPSIQAQVLNVLLDIQARRELALLVISHDLDVVGHLADQIAVMYLGIVVEEGPAAELLTSPLHPYTQALVSAAPSLGARRNGDWKRVVLAGDPPSPTNLPAGCRFHPRCPAAVDRCRSEAPRLVTIEPSRRRVACHLAPDFTRATGIAVARSRTAALH